MAAEENKALARRFYAEVWNSGNMASADELIDANCVDHAAPPGFPPGIAGVKQVFMMYRAAFPDLQVNVEDMLAEGDRVAARWSSSGTHQGELMGIPATGKQVQISGIDLFRISGGKIAEHWGSFDQLGLMQQLGAVPGPG